MKFYEMTNRGMDDLLLDHDESMSYERVVCPVNTEHQRRGRKHDPLRVVYGSELKDVMWTMFECVIQDHVLEIFKKEGLTGFTVKPVEVKKKLFTTPPKLWELQVTGWAGIAPEESGIQLVQSCDRCGALAYSKASDATKIISERQWDGSDFFMVWPLPLYRFVGPKVKEVFEKYNISGVIFKDVSEYPKDKFKNGFGPGRLHYGMPESRAHEIGDPLGIY